VVNRRFKTLRHYKALQEFIGGLLGVFAIFVTVPKGKVLKIGLNVIFKVVQKWVKNLALFQLFCGQIFFPSPYRRRRR
jgi:hypothetical protein